MTRHSSGHTPRFISTVCFFLYAISAIVHAVEEVPGGRESPLAAPLKIATVDMRELYKQYYRSTELEKEMGVHQARIQKEDGARVARAKELEERLGKIRKQLEDPSLNDSKKQSLFKTWQAGQQEAIALDRERREFVQRRAQALNEEMRLRMKAILGEIRGMVEEWAKSEDFDHVLDRSGLSGFHVPILLYAKDSTDITGTLLKGLNRGAPAENPVTKTAGEDRLEVEAGR
ncbi:OmpH family outer membrane protein [Luteolibacter yonseiensis]|uniref:OmpH family outer membrane protein n=1 Tax=Luteolibacter yonseiensis TaxID=1144680 RepID=A0A934VAI0_9BACT|nr:OmpH family outer membrane protein [Luteolibacter yonseiensis]MBK1814881.1 OmpH family outer membrane protein [Luteolibacter yonseiensis]